MVQLESYDRDEKCDSQRPFFGSSALIFFLSRITGAMPANTLAQYFRGFLIKLSTVESQLGPLLEGS